MSEYIRAHKVIKKDMLAYLLLTNLVIITSSSTFDERLKQKVKALLKNKPIICIIIIAKKLCFVELAFSKMILLSESFLLLLPI